PNYRIPFRSIAPYNLVSPMVGIAQGAVDAFEEQMRHRLYSRTGSPMAEAGGMQMRLAESEAEVRVARLLMESDGREIYQRAARGEMPSKEERARYRRDHVYVSRLCVQSVNRLFEGSGGHSIFESSELQRFHRDLHAASHHVSLFWDFMAMQYTRARLGMELISPDL
ncbi:MAG: acyl-CoA dehydrogenase family protein, partial [Dehalococcoidia bacterium]